MNITWRHNFDPDISRWICTEHAQQFNSLILRGHYKDIQSVLLCANGRLEGLARLDVINEGTHSFTPRWALRFAPSGERVILPLLRSLCLR